MRTDLQKEGTGRPTRRARLRWAMAALGAGAGVSPWR